MIVDIAHAHTYHMFFCIRALYYLSRHRVTYALTYIPLV